MTTPNSLKLDSGQVITPGELPKAVIDKTLVALRKAMATEKASGNTALGPADEMLEKQYEKYGEIQEGQYQVLRQAAFAAREYKEIARGLHPMGAAMVAVAKYNHGGEEPNETLEKILGKGVAKSLNISIGTEGAVLVQGEVINLFFGPLYERSTLMSLNLRSWPTRFGVTSYEVTGFETRPTGTWGSEPFVQNAFTEPTTGSRQLTMKILGIKTAVTKDFINAPEGAQNLAATEELLRVELVKNVDEQGINGTEATQYRPKGLRGFIGTAVTPQSGVTLAAILLDHALILTTIDDALIPMSNPAIILSNRAAINLQWSVLDNDAHPFFNEEMTRGTIFGFPFRSTHWFPKTLGAGGDESLQIYLDRDEVWAAMTPAMEFSFNEHSYTDGTGTLVSPSDRREMVMRGFVQFGMLVPHTDAVHSLTGDLIGAPP